MTKKLIVGTVAVYALALGAVIALLDTAAPGPDNQAILGVRIGGVSPASDIVWLSGKRLGCTNSAGEPLASTCSIEIAGQTLTLSAQRSPTGAEVPCTASYGGQTWPCHLGGGKTVSTNWFAILDKPLGLSASQIGALRARYPVENLPETPFVVALFVLPILNTLVCGVAAWRLIPSGLKKNVLVWGANAAAGVAICLLSVFFWLRLTSAFWD